MDELKDVDEGIPAAAAGGLGAGASDSSVPSGPADLRLRRILDYLNESLAKENALEANLGAANSDLLYMAYCLKQAIEAALATTPVALDQFRNLMPAVDSYLRIVKQIDRFAQLDVRLASSRDTAKAVRQKGCFGRTGRHE